jgi:hypothetical protein
VDAWTRDLVLFVVTLLTALGCARYYVVAVLDGDKPLSRAAAVGLVVFGAAAVVFLVRIVL